MSVLRFFLEPQSGGIVLGSAMFCMGAAFQRQDWLGFFVCLAIAILAGAISEWVLA